jgi:two-component system sensor histidine kinase RpfC
MKMKCNKGNSTATEFEQSMLRIAGVSLFSLYALYLAHTGKLPDKNINLLMSYGAFYLPASFFVCVFIAKDIFSSKVRQHSGIILDIVSITICLIYFSEYGMPLFVVYLWVIIGNGFRYGFRKLIFSTFLSMLGFGIVVGLAPYWKSDMLVVVMGYMLLSIIPFYVGILLKRLQKEKERAEMASLEKSRFLANVSHELRTPLNAVIGFSESLGNPDSQVSQQHLVVGIKNSAKSLLSLVDGVLNFSRIEAGHIDLVEKPLDLYALVESVSAMFSLEAEKKGLSLRCELAPGLPHYICSDEDRLRQILVNLTGNAVKFTEAGKVHIRAEVTSTAEADKRIRFVVEDTGIGISDETKPYVFERFKQADGSARRQYGGTGLGAAISRRLVEAMDGDIGFESKYGEGSRFWFTIPCKSPGITTPEPGHTSSAADIPIMKNGRSLRVLIAEDSEINRMVFREQCSLLGVAPVLVDSGLAALEALANDNVDVMILDIQMPGISGLDVIGDYIEGTDIADRIPIVVITGDATEDIQAECEQLGVHSFLAKPVELDKLRAVLMEFTDGREMIAAAV